MSLFDNNTAGKISGINNKVGAATNVLQAFLVSEPGGDYDVKAADNKTFMFAIRGEDSFEVTSDITDHYIEDNSYINDQIALRPEVIRLQAFIGELTNKKEGIEKFVKDLTDKLGVLEPFVPGIAVGAQRAYNTINSAYQTGSNAVNTVTESFKSAKSLLGYEVEETKTQQEESFQWFYNRWQKRILFNVQTPWMLMDSMAIESMRAVQDEETNTITDIEITFKKVKFAKDIFQNSLLGSGRNLEQMKIGNPANKGTQQGGTTTQSPSLLKAGFNNLLGG